MPEKAHPAMSKLDWWCKANHSFSSGASLVWPVIAKAKELVKSLVSLNWNVGRLLPECWVPPSAISKILLQKDLLPLVLNPNKQIRTITKLRIFRNERSLRNGSVSIFTSRCPWKKSFHSTWFSWTDDRISGKGVSSVLKYAYSGRAKGTWWVRPRIE